MATVSEQKAIHAAHEAGRHDVYNDGYPTQGPQPDKCKICARLKKEQEAQDMAKIKTQCPVCGGTYDGTPSGKMKHDGTAKHHEASPLGDPLTEPQPETPEATKVAADSRIGKVIVGLTDIITERSRERDRRVTDHKWRVANRPDQAGEYFDSKVAPLQKELEVLQEAKAALTEYAEAIIA